MFQELIAKFREAMDRSAVREQARRNQTIRQLLRCATDDEVRETLLSLPRHYSTTFGGQRFQYPDSMNFLKCLPPASKAISVGDLIYWDGTNCRPLSDWTLLGTQTLDQQALATKFMGVATSGRIAAQASSVWPADYLEICGNTPYLADCASATFEIGDLVGIVRNGGATAILDQNVVAVTMPALAIGEVIRREPTAVTSVLIRVYGKQGFEGGNNPNAQGIGSQQGTGVTALTDANQTLTPSSTPILNMVPTAARNVKLPVEANSQRLVFFFTNNSAGAFSVTFQSSAAGSIKGNGVVPQNKTGYFWCDGTNWNGLVSA